MSNQRRTSRDGANHECSGDVHMASPAEVDDGMTLLKRQVANFLSTLQEYSSSCAESRRFVEERMLEVRKVEEESKDVWDEAKAALVEAKKETKKGLSEFKKVKQKMSSMVTR